MGAPIGEPGNDLIALAYKLLDVVVKIRKRVPNSLHVLFEFFNAIYDSADRTAESDVGRDEIFDCLRAPCIPKLRVVFADK
jgi:hypothetical protein